MSTLPKFPVYLYVKTHNKTGLKYFGRTTRKDVDQYTGSGKYWLRHLDLHGYDITTEVVGVFDNSDDLHAAAIAFSQSNNIVESDEWANLIVEDGFGGGFKPWDDDRRLKYSATVKGRVWFNNGITQKLAHECPDGFVLGRLPSPRKGKSSSLRGRPMTEEEKTKRRKPKSKTENYKQPKTEEMKSKLRNKRWWKNEQTGECVFTETCPLGFIAGRC